MTLCTRCILPDTYPRIRFDEHGVCSVCKIFTARYQGVDYNERQRELEKIIKRAKRKKRQYDCMVPISGGRDSSMVLYLAVKVLGMKALAFNYDNGFFSEQAKNNMEVMTRALDVDFMTYRPRVSTMLKAYRVSFLKTGDFCIPCNRGVTTGIYTTAFAKRIPLILLGYCSKTDAIPRDVERFDQRLMTSVLGGDMAPGELRPFRFPQVKRVLVPRINVPDYFNWKETENFRRLSQSFSGVDFSGDVHYDCRVSGVADYLKRKKWGFGKKEMKLAVYVRDGLLTRDEALAQLKDKDKEPPETEYWLRSLDLSREDMERGKDRSYDGFKSYNFALLKFLHRHTKLVSFPYEDEE